MATKVDNFNETTELCIVFYPSTLYTIHFFSSTNKYKQQTKKTQVPHINKHFYIRFTHTPYTFDTQQLTRQPFKPFQNHTYCNAKRMVLPNETIRFTRQNLT